MKRRAQRHGQAQAAGGDDDDGSDDGDDDSGGFGKHLIEFFRQLPELLVPIMSVTKEVMEMILLIKTNK